MMETPTTIAIFVVRMILNANLPYANVFIIVSTMKYIPVACAILLTLVVGGYL